MNKIISTFSLLLTGFLASAQTSTYPKADPLKYPFGPIGDSAARGVFGADDRKEVNDVNGIADFTRATAVMIPKKNINGNRISGNTLRERLTYLHKSKIFDENVKFLDQPTCANCTGFLIAPDILVTAGHCIEKLEDAKDYAWVFDYTVDKVSTTGTSVSVKKSDIYYVEEVMSAYFQDISTYTDYSVLKLNRKSERAPYRFRTSDKVSSWDNVYTIGSPTGLPLKFADNAIVVDNTPTNWFKNSIDGFPGNSGGPVFNKNGFIEGIHVRGAVELHDGTYTGDYAYDKDCDCIKTVQWNTTAGTAGSHSHRITAVPSDVLKRALYENVLYAMETNNMDRYNTWAAYSWLFDMDYTAERGRLEFEAAKNDNWPMVRSISQNLKNISTVDKDGKNLLFYAIEANKSSELDYFLKKGLSPNTVSNSQQTPLSLAIQSNKTDLATLLLKRGSKVDTKDNQGNTPLILAVNSGNMELVKSLVAKGASLSTKNNIGHTALKRAKKLKLKPIKKFLKKAGK
ncbi:ankyrin repeat domain-containing protein [Bacteroidia bacterium]|nr:ankyrin repeat domain-containing protein [Bacteroidia bacterium]MDB4107408.1 ankyrin repeat domain-containing protein [Bacteroidia bacterium]MDB9883285.1 ankyrin repeat domain-containing protein [Bacteroidia bacterium]